MTLAEEYALPELVVTFLFVVADIEVGVAIIRQCKEAKNAKYSPLLNKNSTPNIA